MKQAHKHHLLSISFLANRAFSLEHSSFNKLNLDYGIRLVSRSYQTCFNCKWVGRSRRDLGVKCVVEQRHFWLPAARGGSLCALLACVHSELSGLDLWDGEKEKRRELQLQVCVVCVDVWLCVVPRAQCLRACWREARGQHWRQSIQTRALSPSLLHRSPLLKQTSSPPSAPLPTSNETISRPKTLEKSNCLSVWQCLEVNFDSLPSKDS